MPSFVFRLFMSIPKDLLIDSISSINTDIMNFLSIDCSTDVGSLFVKIENRTFIEVLQSDKSNSDLLMKKILDFLVKYNLKLDDMSQVFVNQGPGNFSGLRGSLAVAKGVCLSKNLNIFGYNTFIWPCAKFYNKQDFIYSFIKFREKYFIKQYDKKLNSISKIKEITKDEILNKYDDKFKVISKKSSKYFDDKILKLKNLSIVDLDHNDLESLRIKGLLDENFIKPLYLT